ncbi:hypothetical protein PISMIDRAFT_680980 [Pisolithus microcarpus 441]|uniref:Uncharacterized protein n=1 Tax=Pisolithus microcarpus 441 TaxID=765257 RepID=A0A0C9YAS2_9AGAM|nr:hypothetical protein PISMIDRAFT_680980 [Pisolithus microcarpus 441]
MAGTIWLGGLIRPIRDLDRVLESNTSTYNMRSKGLLKVAAQTASLSGRHYVICKFDSKEFSHRRTAGDEIKWNQIRPITP